MSLARGRVHVLCRRSARAAFSGTQSRLASSDPHSHHDSNVYPQEGGFTTPFWRNTLIFSLLGVGLYNLVPYIDKDGDYITRYIQHYATPGDVWARINQKHLEQATHAAEGQILISGATRPPVIRMRNPGSFDVGSPHCVAVGGQADVSNVAIKKDKPWTE